MQDSPSPIETNNVKIFPTELGKWTVFVQAFDDYYLSIFSFSLHVSLFFCILISFHLAYLFYFFVF